MKKLSEKALLVNLCIRQWSARKYDRKATDEVNSAHNATDAGRFNKLLISKQALTDIQRISNSARQFHYNNTLPWSDQGDRLLPTTNYFEYFGEMSRFKAQFDEYVQQFVSGYDRLVAEAQLRLNSLFDPTDYPDDVSDKFSLTVVPMPVPEVQDFRVELNDTDVDSLRVSIEKEVNSRFTAATESIYDRISEQLKHMHSKLIDPDAVFRDSMFENLQGMIELLPRLNFSGDAKILMLCDDLKKLYCDPDSVRSNKDLRAEKATEVNAILNNIPKKIKSWRKNY